MDDDFSDAKRKKKGGIDLRSAPRFTATGQVFPDLFQNLGWAQQWALHEVYTRWPEIAGDAALHSVPVALRNGMLWLYVRHSVWAQELLFRQYDLLSRVRPLLNGRVVDGIRCQVEPSWFPEEPPPPPPPPEPPSEPVPTGFAGIADTACREALVGLWRMWRRNEKKSNPYGSGCVDSSVSGVAEVQSVQTPARIPEKRLSTSPASSSTKMGLPTLSFTPEPVPENFIKVVHPACREALERLWQVWRHNRKTFLSKLDWFGKVYGGCGVFWVSSRKNLKDVKSLHIQSGLPFVFSSSTIRRTIAPPVVGQIAAQAPLLMTNENTVMIKPSSALGSKPSLTDSGKAEPKGNCFSVVQLPLHPG